MFRFIIFAFISVLLFPSSALALDSSFKMATVDYTLWVNRKIIDTTIQSIAQSSGIYKIEGSYKPFVFRLGVGDVSSGEVIHGFEEAVKKMKLGDKKMVIIPPKKAYGGKYVIEKVPVPDIAPEYELYSSLSFFQESPFYGKDIKVGTQVTQGNEIIKILGITQTGGTILIKNMESPFYGKKYGVGSIAKKGGQEFKILKITKDSVTVRRINQHPLAGKWLKFEIQLRELNNE